VRSSTTIVHPITLISIQLYRKSSSETGRILMEGRSRFTSEDDADELIQASYAKTKMRKIKGLFYIVCVVLILVFAFLGPFMVGGSLSPLHMPIWPSIVLPLVICVVAMSGGIYFNYVIARQAVDEFDRNSHLKRTSTRALVIMGVAIFFMVLFLTITPLFETSWLEKMVDEKAGSYDYEVSGYGVGDFTFTPNDQFDVAEGKVEVKVIGNASIDFFLGEHDKFKDIAKDNISELEGNSIPKGVSYNATNFTYDGDLFESGESYVLRMYNYGSDNDIICKIIIHRNISPRLTWTTFFLCLIIVIIAGLTFGIMHGLSKVKVKAPAKQPARARGARGAADMFNGMEGEVEEMFGPGTGFRDGRVPAGTAGAAAGRRGGRRPPPRGAGRRGPAPGGRAPPRGRPGGAAAGRARTRRPPPTDAELEVPPRGTKKTISCPRCKKRFSYVKIEGEVIDIQCPNCGKRGRVGKKAAPAPARPKPRPERPRPAKAPPKPARTPSPLDEITGPARVMKKTLACPKCKRKFSVEERPRPFDIQCPHCGKKGRLK